MLKKKLRTSSLKKEIVKKKNTTPQSMVIYQVCKPLIIFDLVMHSKSMVITDCT